MTNKLNFIKLSFIIFTLLVFSLTGKSYASDARIDAVFVAQTHVSKPDYEYFNLTANRPALLKVHVVAEDYVESPEVIAIITHKSGEVNEFKLNGPRLLPHPEALSSEKGVVAHSYSDTFNGILPAQWVQPDMYITIKAGEDVFKTQLKVSAPNAMFLQMFDIKLFGTQYGKRQYGVDYPEDAITEIAGKLPISSLSLDRVRDIVFPEVLVPANKKNKTTHTRVSSAEQYKKLTGHELEGEEEMALRWVKALSEAGAANYLSVMYVNLVGKDYDSLSSDFVGVGPIGNSSDLFYNLGEAFGLKNWQNEISYPYRGGMHGIDAPDFGEIKPKDRVHVGPIWGYDMGKSKFISPKVQPGSASGPLIGKYKREPMEGGGAGDQDQGYHLRHFSDFSIYKMQKFIQKKLAVLAEDGMYYKWNQSTGSYSNSVKAKVGIEYPLELYSDVISILVGATVLNEKSNIVYPPIGPYKGNIKSVFDPNNAKDREKATLLGYCPDNGCDFTLKVLQENETYFYMLPIAGDENADPFDPESLVFKAINIPAADGEVQQASLLFTPDANLNGIDERPLYLYGWTKASQNSLF